MSQPNLLELAKQGDAKAIATLMNRQLQPKGITAKATIRHGCLQVMLESTQLPTQQKLVAFVRQGITSLGVVSINRLKIYGQRTGEQLPVWQQEFEIPEQQLSLPNSTATQIETPSLATRPRHSNLPEHDKQKGLPAFPKWITDLISIAKIIFTILRKDKQAGQAFLVFLALVFLFSGCVYQVGYPWNCGQAKEAVQKAQNNYDSNYQEQLRKVTVDRDTVNSMYVMQMALNRAKDKEYEMCKK